jgi:hypothetical protein
VKLDLPLPEIYTVNLVWNGAPSPSEILRLMIAIPEKTDLAEIYDLPSSKGSDYAFRGMICFQGAHYIAYFRRILIKFDFQEINFNQTKKDLSALNAEITS